jgi:hypothetical protein
MKRRLAGAPVAALLLGLAAHAGAAEPAAGADATRATMGRIVDSMAFVLPLATSDDRFADPAQHKAIQAALEALAAEGAKVEGHGRGRDPGFGFLARSLARDTREIRDRFAAGRRDEARFLLLELSDHCAACHSRLPDAREHPVGRRLVDDPRVAALAPDERVNLEVATRQFDRALAGYEALFADPARPPADLDLEGQVDGYLEVVVRVQNDPERALRTFSALAQRKDLPPALRENVAAWIASLRALRGRSFPGAPLAEARALVAEAQDVSRHPDDRSALVLYLAASGILHRFSAGEPSRAELAEACYLLGVIESRVGRSFWLSQTEFFLEQAIRLAPQKPFANDAYELLEEFLISGYGGMQASELPPEPRARLDELRGLIRRAQGGAETAPAGPLKL